MSENIFFYTNIQNNNSNKNDNNSLVNGPILSQLIVFLIGWLGINLISLLVQLITLSFVKIPDQELDPEGYLAVVNKINGPMQFATYIVTTIIVLVVLGLPLLKRIFKDFTKLEKIGKGVIYGFILLGVSILYGLLVQTLYPNMKDNENQTAINGIIKNYPILSGIMIVLLAPVLEEITYRFGLFGICNHKNKYIGFVISSLVFGLIHTNFIGLSQEELIIELLNFPSYALSGLILSFAFYKEDSLATSMTAHAVNNLIAYISSLGVAEIVMHVI